MIGHRIRPRTQLHFFVGDFSRYHKAEGRFGETAQISLLSPIGIALLGLRAGDGMPVFMPERGFHTLRVVGGELELLGTTNSII
jgi:hypothetical protein